MAENPPLTEGSNGSQKQGGYISSFIAELVDLVSMMQIQKLMDDLPGLNVIIKEDTGDEFGAFSEWLEKASDEEIIAELKRWGLKKEDEPHIASVLPIVRRATEADEDFDDYLRRTGTKLTEDQDEAAAILGQFAWEQTGCGTNTTKNGRDSGEADPTPRQADKEATTSRGRNQEDATPQQPTSSSQPQEDSQSNEARWAAAIAYGLSVPEPTGNPRPSAEQLALIQQLSPEQAMELSTILRIVFESTGRRDNPADSVSDALGDLEKEGIKAQDPRLEVVVAAGLRLKLTTFSLASFWSAIEPSERAAIRAVEASSSQ